MRIDRRDFVGSALAGAACLAAGAAVGVSEASAARRKPVSPEKGYRYRSAFGCWINDMRHEPLPFAGWPAPELDEECVTSIIHCLDMQQEAGFNLFDVWGLFATTRWPRDIVSAVDKTRRRNINRVLKAARERGITPIMGFGTYSWGYEQIMEEDPATRGKNADGSPHAAAMCGASPRSFDYIKAILDFTLSEFDIGGVHLESCDLGCCMCPECAGKDGMVPYNIRLNTRTADYIKSKWPDRIVYVITISWTGYDTEPELKAHTLTEEQLPLVIELSKHIDCLFDQGHLGYHVDPRIRRDFIKKLHCPYGTSGGDWLYHAVQVDRLSYFVPYGVRDGKAIQEQYADGVRAALFYMGPSNNPGVEYNTAVAGRMLVDPSRDVENTVSEVVEMLYKPKSADAGSRLVGIHKQAEEALFSAMPKRGEFQIYNFRGGLWSARLDEAGRKAYSKSLKPILKELIAIEGGIGEKARLRRLKQCLMTTLLVLDSMP